MSSERNASETREEGVMMKPVEKNQPCPMGSEKGREEEEGESEGREFTLTEEMVHEILGPVEDTQ